MWRPSHWPRHTQDSRMLTITHPLLVPHNRFNAEPEQRDIVKGKKGHSESISSLVPSQGGRRHTSQMNTFLGSSFAPPSFTKWATRPMSTTQKAPETLLIRTYILGYTHIESAQSAHNYKTLPYVRHFRHTLRIPQIFPLPLHPNKCYS